MKGRYFHLLILFISILFLQNCDTIFHKNVKEGSILFEIKYPENEAGDLMAGLLPNEMVLKFKNDKTAGTFSAGMGVFEASLITDPHSKSVLQLLKIMNERYVQAYDSTEIGELFSELPEIKIVKTDEEKTIAGYNCKKAIVTFKDNIKEEFNVYYTNDIGIKNSNWCTPFREIDGVLLEYQVRKYNYEMRLTALEVVKEEIDDNAFSVPKEYENISKQKMDEILEPFKNI